MSFPMTMLFATSAPWFEHLGVAIVSVVPFFIASLTPGFVLGLGIFCFVKVVDVDGVLRSSGFISLSSVNRFIR